MSNLSDALNQIRSELIHTDDPIEEIISDTAEAFGLREELLFRKVAENGWTRDRLRSNATATSEEYALAERVQEKTDAMCKKYRVDPARTIIRTVRGEDFTLICRLSNARTRRYVGVSHKDGKAYRLNL